jgi:hypothetical protein
MLAVIGFGLAGGIAYLDERGMQRVFQNAQEGQRQCWTEKVRCDMLQNYETLMMMSAQARHDDETRKQMFITAAVAMPAGLFLLFFAGRWIVNGKRPNPALDT